MTRRPPLLLLLGLSLLHCVPTGAFEPIGTIEAVMDGQPRTWYIPGGRDSSTGSGAMWMSVSPGVGTAVLGGFESRDVEFGMDPASGIPTATGEGSQIVITFEFLLDVTSAESSLSGQDFSILFLPAIGDHGRMQGMDQGKLSASLVQASRTDASQFEGTFSGRLVDGDGQVRARLVEGGFKVHGAIFFDPE